MSEPPAVQAIVDKILGGEAPLALRSAAARGAVPLPRPVLARLHLHLLEDPEDEIRLAARTSLDALGEDEIREMFSDPECPVEILGHFAERAVKQVSLAELLVFHRSAPDPALSLLAQRGNAAVIELVLTNQERLLASPGLLDCLTNNPALRPDQRGRILDMLDRFISRRQEQADGDAPTGDDNQPASTAEEIEEAARILNVDVGELFAASEIVDGAEFEESEDPEIRSTYKKIMILNTAQKAILAMKGGREERMILIRDSNKLVSLSVLRNPRINEQEIENIATMRNVTDEVLRVVGTTREWVKSYTVVSALVHNPRTPPGVSTNFIPRMNSHDLKSLRRDKNVPEIIRKIAAKTIEVRQRRSQPRFLKRK